MFLLKLRALKLRVKEVKREWQTCSLKSENVSHHKKAN